MKNLDIKPKHNGTAKQGTEHWEVRTNICPEGDNSGEKAFFPRKGKDRPSMHNKVNDCDH